MQFRGGMSELMRQASRMQRKIEETKAKLKEKTVEVTGASDKVKVVASYGREVISLQVDPEFFKSEGQEMVQDAILATVNAALNKANELMEAEMEKATGGMKVPGMV
jgi:DNA-binding YbaB/EbfC family protein